MLSIHFPHHSRSYFQYLIEHGAVTCNGKKTKKGVVPKVGDEIHVSFLDTPEMTLNPQDILLDILFEDEHIICINKPAGMVVHPAPGHPDNTLVNALLHHCHLPFNSQPFRPGIVHRLDRYTSGVLIVAKKIEAYQKLITAFSMRKIYKEYLAITIGNPGNQTLLTPMGRHPIKRKKQAILSTGKEALTHIETLATHGNFSLVKAIPVTGRSHQIRVHLKYLNTPILGDDIYGLKKANQTLKVKRQLLHAYHVTFSHPILSQQMQITAPLPKDLQKLMETIDNEMVEHFLY